MYTIQVAYTCTYIKYVLFLRWVQMKNNHFFHRRKNVGECHRKKDFLLKISIKSNKP